MTGTKVHERNLIYAQTVAYHKLPTIDEKYHAGLIKGSNHTCIIAKLMKKKINEKKY